MAGAVHTATMSAGDWIAASLVVAGAFLVAALLVTLLYVSATLRRLRRTLGELQTETLEAVTEMRTIVRDAGEQAERVDALLATAEAVGQTLDGASRFAVRTVSSPVVKALALGTGTRRAMRRMRRADGTTGR